MSTIDLTEVAGARATHRYARLSASKARAVLDLIRDHDVADAADILRFSERGAAEVIAKVLASAVANATNNEGLDEDELYVAECFANEGPTLKRWRPRARGRATRINKRTCHITVVVARLDDEELEMREAATSAAATTPNRADRRARVAASRQADNVPEDAASDDDVQDAIVDTGADAEELDAPTDTPEADNPEAVAEWNAEDADADGEANVADESPYGEGSMAPPADGSIPEGFPVKGNADSMKYHEPGGRWYDSTVAEVYFASAEAAEAAGFTKAGSRAKAADTEGEEA
ncbi:MAG: 50S ribosomal protein L22 [Acidimicrobiales bacterium]|nr:50S ribosomal protein L22 [Acidimicrobiales bacterium]